MYFLAPVSLKRDRERDKMPNNIKTPERLFAYLAVGEQFLHLAELACNELVNSGNPIVLVRELRKGAPPTDEKNFPVEECLEATKWSDIRISIPVVFNFYHGIELILKEFIADKEWLKGLKDKHKLTELLTKFNEEHSKTTQGQTIANIIGKYTCCYDKKSPLGKFFVKNNITPDKWYESLKYPESNKGQSFSHFDLKYGSSNTIKFWESISEDAHYLQQEANKLAITLKHP